MLEFVHPVGERRLGHEDHVRPVDVPEVLHVAEERDGLQRFAKTHFVGQNSVDAVLVEGDHPVEAADLARSSTSR